ncbi:MAG: D-2-hydroxyacid dehydrogenase [Gammaproteobacteria bacterium]|nr:D-2-hydroxyacid dehydrogenase [Gammaproteobacteria bacterium]
MRGVVLDLDTLHPADLDLAALDASLDEWQWHSATAPAQLIERLAGCTVVVTNKVPISRETMTAAPALRLICVSATGVNNIDLDAARERGIAVCNVCDYATPGVGQHVLALLLALATRWHDYAADVRAGDWSRAKAFCLMHRPVLELAGRTCGIIGYGALGREVARLVEALGMRVLIGASLRPGVVVAAGRVPLAELCARSDVISLHCPLDSATEKLVDRDFLHAMKPGSLLINTARGGLVDEHALKDALLSGHLGGAALDVLSAEPPPHHHPLLDPAIPNLLITPHCAWVSRESRQRLLDGVAANVRAWRCGQLINRVE